MSSEMMQLSLEDAVNSKYGSDALRKHFYGKKANSKKGKGNLGTNQTKQLLRNLQVDWHKVELSGNGADRIITCIGKKEVPTERQDNRVNNGQGQIPYEGIIRNLVLLYLNQDKDHPATTTIKVLARELGLMSDTLYFASKKITSNQQKAHYDNLDKKYQVGYSMFWHIVPRESERIKNHLKSVLKKMSEAGIIYLRDVTNAVTIDENGENHNPIDNIQAFEIKKTQRNLREKHDVTVADLRYRPKHHKVLAYKEDEQEYFDSLDIHYIYDAMIIGLIATDKEIKHYMKDSLIIDFKNSHACNAERLAKKIQDDFFNKLLKAKDNHKLVEELGGQAKPEHAIFKGTEYELVVQESQRLAYDAIAQAKVADTYPNEYSNKLRAIQDVDEQEKNKCNL
ncbi:hypothetical protein H7F28_03535 [Brevibacterium sp. PAMC23299]|nr:hypothetical protein H7F28_03535 [Brevibacterium sp. PAMC23299]